MWQHDALKHICRLAVTLHMKQTQCRHNRYHLVRSHGPGGAYVLDTLRTMRDYMLLLATRHYRRKCDDCGAIGKRDMPEVTCVVPSEPASGDHDHDWCLVPHPLTPAHLRQCSLCGVVRPSRLLYAKVP